MKSKLVNFTKTRAIYMVLALLCVLFAFLSDKFISINNVLNLIRQVAVLGISSVGLTFVMLTGGIDLSTGSVITMVNIIGAYGMVKMGLPPLVACIIALAVATLVGFINGVLVANLNMPALIVTFASQIILEGLAYILCGGLPIFGFPTSFMFLGQGYLLGVPVPIWVMGLCFAVGIFILGKTYFGRYFCAVGSNEGASRLSGIRVKRVKYLAYTFSAFFAGIGGLVMLSRTNSGQPTAGKGFEFDIITAVVLGGVSVSGGTGRLSNVVAGALIIGVLGNGMVLLDINTYYQMVVKGLILAVAVGFDCVQRDRPKKAKKIQSR